MNTIIYLVKHAEEFKEDGIKNIDESTQIMNEKLILSVKGEEQAKKLSENNELQNIDVLWTSSYARAKGTAKYIADKNSITMNIDYKLNERKLGDLSIIAEWMKDKKYGIIQEYLLNKEWKSLGGESCNEVIIRANDFINKILHNYNGKRIVLVSHGALISFLLTNWCKLDENVKLVYNNKVIEIREPSITKLTFSDNELLDIEQIDI